MHQSNFLSSVCFRRGWQGLIAQGCHSSILIIDPKTSQTIQVLERHKANVVKVSSQSSASFLFVPIAWNKACVSILKHIFFLEKIMQSPSNRFHYVCISFEFLQSKMFCLLVHVKLDIYWHVLFSLPITCSLVFSLHDVLFIHQIEYMLC